jgi:hypothetical protein
MSVCLCERGARIHTSPRLAYRADIRQETPVHPTLWVCRRCVIWDHYIPSPITEGGIGPLIRNLTRKILMTRKGTNFCGKEKQRKGGQ